MTRNFLAAIRGWLMVLAILALPAYGFTQSRANIDSLQNRLTEETYDTAKVVWNYKIAQEYWYVNLDTAELFSRKAIEQGEKFGFKKGIAGGHFALSVTFLLNHKTEDAIFHAEKCIAIYKEVGFDAGVVAISKNLAAMYSQSGQHEEAERVYNDVLAVYVKTDNKLKVATTIHDIGVLYERQSNYAKASENYYKSYRMFYELEDKNGLGVVAAGIGKLYEVEEIYDSAMVYFRIARQQFSDLENIAVESDMINGIATVFKNQGHFDSAFVYAMQYVAVAKKMNDNPRLADATMNIGVIYEDQLEMDSALHYYQIAYDLSKQYQDRTAFPDKAYNLGHSKFEFGAYQEGVELCREGLEIAEQFMLKKEIGSLCSCLAQGYDSLRQHTLALKYLKRSVDIKDSLRAKDVTRSIANHEMQYRLEVDALRDSTLKVQQDIINQAKVDSEKSKTAQQKIYTFFALGGVVLLLLLAVALFRNFKQKKRDNAIISEQKKEVEVKNEKLKEQKEIVEEKNKEITDSINYAQRIQNAILPPDRLVKQYLENSFILYQPKDIVAGDFYWMEVVGDNVIFAAADCTGHGVPGAMVSVVCHNAMNRAVREFGLLAPAKILDKVRELVIEQFEKSEEDVKDGMDIALCVLNTKDKTLQYAGANNPLWIIRNSEVQETKADKQPIGKYAENKPFTNHQFELQPNDTLYIFSDGYVDQFGGEKGKKYKARAFRNLLLSMQDQPLLEQRKLIHNEFETWKGDIEQVDDVCVIGVRI
jgi:serine phosphatase RsbU (regulator of sigma subunit)